MMSSYTSKSDDLCKLAKMLGEGRRGEGATVVCEEGLDNDTRITTQSLILFFCFQCFMTVEVSLKLNMKVTSGMVHKNAPTTVHLVLSGLSARREESSFGGAHKVINRDFLTWDQLLFLQCTIAVKHTLLAFSRGRKSGLLAKLARRTLGWMCDLTSCGVKTTSGFRGGQDSSAKQVLNLTKTEVPKTKVPPEELLFCCTDVVIGI